MMNAQIEQIKKDHVCFVNSLKAITAADVLDHKEMNAQMIVVKLAAQAQFAIQSICRHNIMKNGCCYISLECARMDKSFPKDRLMAKIAAKTEYSVSSTGELIVIGNEYLNHIVDMYSCAGWGYGVGSPLERVSKQFGSGHAYTTSNCLLEVNPGTRTIRLEMRFNN
jgi:hypothetical protein